MNAVIYTRVSTVEQAEMNKSLDNQEAACKTYASHLSGVKVIKVYTEEGESAKTTDRTQLKELIKYCADKSNDVDILIVWKLDRLARRTEDHIMLKNLFLKLGVRLHSATEHIEDSSSGKLMEHILASFAEFDNSVRAERSSKGMESRLQEGGWVHLAPIGYRNIKDALGRPTVEPDEMASNVQKFLKAFASGAISKTNAAEVAAKKYKIMSKGYVILPNKRRKYSKVYDKPISQSTVYSMLKNPLYAGLVTGKNIVEPIIGLHTHNALITVKEHRAILQVLTGVQEPQTRPYGSNKNYWSLRRFLKCKYCNGFLTGSKTKGRTSSYEYYHCAKCKGAKSKHLTLRRNETHRAFATKLENVQPSEGVLRLFKNLVVTKWNSEYLETIERRSVVENTITELDKKKSGYIEMCRVGTITPIELQAFRDDIAVERTRLETELSDINQEFIDTNKVLDMAVDFMANVSLLWDFAEGENKLRFQNMVFPGGISINENYIFGTTNIGQAFRQANLLKELTEGTKKTHQADESALVTPRRVELLLPG